MMLPGRKGVGVERGRTHSLVSRFFHADFQSNLGHFKSENFQTNQKASRAFIDRDVGPQEHFSCYCLNAYF